VSVAGAVSRRDPAPWLDWPLVALALALKWLTFLYGGLTVEALANRRLDYVDDWLKIWNEWDADHYLEIAQIGYERRALLVYYPLYPWLVKAIGALVGRVDVAAFLLSGIASLAAVLLLQRLVSLDHSREVSRRAAWFLLIYPTSFYLHIAYTEGLFLALTLGCVLSARTGRWPTAGLLGALATLTRVNGLVLVPAVGCEAWAEYRAAGRWQARWLWILAIPLGFAGYLWLNAAVAGDPFAFRAILRSQWHKAFAWPWIGVREGVRSALDTTSIERQVLELQELVFIAIAVLATAVSALRLRASDAVWMAGNTALFTTTGWILSVPRYTLILFPLYLVLARLAERPFWRALITAWSLLFLAFFVSLFVQGHWVS
jgi:hypothetical protein